MRWNCVDHAESGYGSSASSMSRIASAKEFRSFCTRKSCSESLRLRSARSLCNCRSPLICQMMYDE